MENPPFIDNLSIDHEVFHIHFSLGQIHKFIIEPSVPVYVWTNWHVPSISSFNHLKS